jgi:hypothetical protein
MNRRMLLTSAAALAAAPVVPAMAEPTQPPVVINHDPLLDAKIKALEHERDARVGEAGALFAFMGWLTSRSQESGPFSGHHGASQAAELVGEFCKSQGWEITDDYWFKRLRDYPDK